jgi:hypothetical protein
MSDGFSQQRINIKFCKILGKTERGTCAMLSETNGGEAVKKSNVSEWHKKVKEASENVEGVERSSHKRTHRSMKTLKK